jgi:acyl transferase domain-containing protein
VELLVEERLWPVVGRVRRAGVSSFGISGTNAHVIVEQAQEVDLVIGTGDAARTTVPWVLSARTAAGLRGVATRLAGWVPGRVSTDVAWSLATSRSALDHRAVVMGAEESELAAGLAGLAGDSDPGRVVSGVVVPGRTALVFGGQGSQWVGMGRELLAESEVFAKKMADCADALAPHVDWSLLDALGDPELLERVDVVQPALFAVMVSLAEVWRAAGVVVDGVVGHSQGEVAAACVAGALSLSDAARVVAVRSRLLRALSGNGAMASVALPADTVAELVAGYPGVGIAAFNGPSTTVVSGPADHLADLVRTCEQRGVRARVVGVDYASHHPDVETIGDELVAALAGIQPKPATSALWSTVNAAVVAGRELDAEYWFRNLREPVRFQQVVEAMLDEGYRHFVEMSPHPVLVNGVQEVIDGAGVDAVVLGTARRDDCGLARLWLSFGQAWVRGVPVQWERLLPSGRLLMLPTYPFQHRRYWLQPTDPGDNAPKGDDQLWTAIEQRDVTTLGKLLDTDPAALGDLVPLLANWRSRGQEQSVVDGWRYRSAWQLATDQPAARPGRWLVVVPAGRAADPVLTGCLDGLSKAGIAAAVVAVEQVPSRDALSARLQDAIGAEPVSGVLSMLAFAEGVDPSCSSVAAGVAATLALTQALGVVDVAAPLWCVTRGAVSTGPSDPLTEPGQAQLWGLGRVIGAEHSGRWGGLIDLPAEVGPRAASLLAAALCTAPGEDELAVRPAGLLARRLVRATAAAPAVACPVDPDGTVLITGGSGALAGHVARWLVNTGARHLLLVSRRGQDSEAITTLVREVELLGAEADVVACDVSDRDALAAVLAGIPSEHPLTAVVHTAGVLDDGLLDDLTNDRFEVVLRPKLTAAWHLHELTASLRLSAFVLFSSMAGTIGNPGQAAYAAANAGLDALAQYRVDNGLPATSIAWGRWAGAGMAAGSDVSDRQLTRRGIAAMEPQLAVLALAHALAAATPVSLVGSIDWERFLAAARSNRDSRLFDQIPEVIAARETVRRQTAAAEDDAAALRAQLAQLSARDRERRLAELVRSQVSGLLGYQGQEALESHRTFRDIGFDSVLALEFRNLLAKVTGLTLPASLVFDYPSPTEVAGYLASCLRTEPDAAADQILVKLDEIRRTLPTVSAGEARGLELAATLRAMLAELDPDQQEAGSDVAASLDTATDEDIMKFIDTEFGIS